MDIVLCRPADGDQEVELCRGAALRHAARRPGLPAQLAGGHVGGCGCGGSRPLVPGGPLPLQRCPYSLMLAANVHVEHMQATSHSSFATFERSRSCCHTVSCVELR